MPALNHKLVASFYLMSGHRTAINEFRGKIIAGEERPGGQWRGWEDTEGVRRRHEGRGHDGSGGGGIHIQASGADTPSVNSGIG